ncbi:MAG: energy-coupling factor transporter ATPase [Bacillota bacterium]|jgi:energy-coupling factor transport system ATP-binding protein
MPITIEKLSYTYGAGTPFEIKALDQISLSISEGEFIGIIGQTGSGKSTLIQHLNGLILPQSGRVIVDHIDLGAKGADLRQVRERVGLVFQYPEHQLFEETVAKDVAFGPKNLGLSSEEIDLRVEQALMQVGLSVAELGQRSPFELSGGQMRRVAIAGVLAMRPKVLILDEPTAGLDPKGREELLGELRDLHQRNNMTVMLVSHSMEEIAMVASRLIVLHQGKVFADGPPRSVFAMAKQLRAIGLGVPQVTELLQALRDRGLQLPPVALSVPEARSLILDLWRRRVQA